ncbi:hypothetical protein GCM10009818_25710 [Nakamurella flavida]
MACPYGKPMWKISVRLRDGYERVQFRLLESDMFTRVLSHPGPSVAQEDGARPDAQTSPPAEARRRSDG